MICVMDNCGARCENCQGLLEKMRRYLARSSLNKRRSTLYSGYG